MEDRFDFGDIDAIEAEDASTRERRLKQYSIKAMETGARVEQSYVRFPEFVSCIDACDRAFQLSRSLKTPQGVLITGAPGTSKTTVARYFMNSLPQSDLFERGYGALYVRLRTPPTTQQVVTAFLRGLKYPFTAVRRNNVHTMRDNVLESIRQRGTRIVFIDQAHCLASVTNKRNGAVDETTVSDLLVELMDETGASLVLLADARFPGLESVDTALASRVSVRESLSDFKCDELWSGFLKSFAGKTKAIDLSTLFDAEICQRTYVATQGNRRRYRRLIVEATLIACDSDSSVLTRDHLSLGFERTSGNFNEQPNPFRA